MSKFKHADEAQVQGLQTMPVAAFSQSDVSAMFDQGGQSMAIAALSFAEMKETEGAWGAWGAGFGAIGGFSGYAVNSRISGSRWSWSGAGAATFAGARAGAVAGPVGVVWGFNSAIGGGAALGVAQRRGW